MSDYQVTSENNNEPFILDDTAEVIDSLSVTASQGALAIGAVMAEITSTGHYSLVDYSAQDGGNIPKMILAEALADSASVTTNVSMYRWGLFDENQLTFATGTDIDSRLNDELMPNQVDRDFSGASAWANVDVNAYDETDDLTMTASAANQYATLPVASFPTEIGKSYKLSVDVANIVESWTIKDFTGVQTLGVISANATQGSIGWTAQTTGGIRIVADATTSSADFDNFTLESTGDLSSMTMKDILRMFGLRTAPGVSVTGYENS